MSQHDFNIANQSFPATRTDLNNALQALASNSSGDAEPSTTFANQWWYETDTNTLKLRNEANNAWLSFATVDQTTGDWTLAHDVDITGTLTYQTPPPPTTLQLGIRRDIVILLELEMLLLVI
jgi:hypothetical protein